MALYDPVASTLAGIPARAHRGAPVAGRAIERLPFTIRRVET